MKVVEVIVEYSSISLNRPFSYAYFGDNDLVNGIRVIVPFGKKNIVGYVVNCHQCDKTIEQYEKETGYFLKEIVSIIDEKPILNEELILLANKISDYYFAPLISVYQTMLPPSLKPKSTSLLKPKIAYDVYVKAVDDKDESLLTEKQKIIYQNLLNNGPSKKSNIKSSIVDKLIKNGYLETYSIEKRRLNDEEYLKVEDNILNDEQKHAYDSIINSNNQTFLLEGVTGSGKTEVYLHLAKYYIENKKKILILVPEISLSYQMIKCFKERFEKVAILHSSLTDGEKYDEYRKILSSDIDIVIGARSAIFAPLDNIGIIIIDEEHSETYKQENTPYYNSIKVAEMRKEYHKCNLLLGSATPSLESRARAFKGTYKLLTLTKRISTSLPSCKIVDLSNYNEIDEKSIIYSKTLRNEIEERLKKKEQVMLLINRRGYAPYISCRKCGFIFKCPECNMPLTLHKADELLKCHHCGYVASMTDECPKCSSKYIKTNGVGAEKAELELKKIFPNANILRVDSDVAKKRLGIKNALDTFRNNKADILIGTQMISKGLDFKNVTLSAVIQSDIGLNIPSYRASERVFSLLTQTIGRAGRFENGTAIIQTYNPNHYVIKYAKEQDYEGFYSCEMKYRKLLFYPPFCYTTLITLSSKNEELLKKNIIDIKNFLMSEFENKNVIIVGPSEFYVGILNKKYRRKFLLKYKNRDDITNTIKKLLEMYALQNIINISINVDPIEDY